MGSTLELTDIIGRAPAATLPRAGQQRQAFAAVQHMRLMVLMLLFAALIAAILLRLAWLGITVDHDAGGGAAGGALRGDIVDRNGEPLARTIEAWTIGVHPKKVIGDREVIARKLADLMPEEGDVAHFRALLASSKSFLYLDRRASPALVEAVNAIGEPGIVFERETQRLYPEGTLAAHVLGFVASGSGQSGIERARNDLLSGGGTAPVTLSIDTRVQAAMESELGQAMTTFSARGAAGVVLDVDTGEVISMVSLPTFNPNRIGMATADQLRNNTVQSVYELGSTFKPITVATALDTGVVSNIARRFDATAPLHVGRFTIHDEEGDPKRWLNMPELLIYSSNIATARVADELGPQRMQTMFQKLGLGTKPDIELMERGHPIWPTYWARTTTMTTAYGHGIAITPLQLAAAYAALVNGGTWRPSTLLKVGPGHPVAPGRRVISEKTSYQMRQMLRLIVLKGTGRKADAPGYRIGGKTGTGEIPAAGGYDRSRNMATFVGVFPVDKPRYVVLSMLDSPQGTAATGGWKTAAYNAAPVVGRVVNRVGTLLGVMPDLNRDIDERDMLPLLWQSPSEKQADAR